MWSQVRLLEGGSNADTYVARLDGQEFVVKQIPFDKSEAACMWQTYRFDTITTTKTSAKYDEKEKEEEEDDKRVEKAEDEEENTATAAAAVPAVEPALSPNRQVRQMALREPVHVELLVARVVTELVRQGVCPHFLLTYGWFWCRRECRVQFRNERLRQKRPGDCQHAPIVAYALSEWCSGGSLHTMLTRYAENTVQRLRTYVFQVLTALYALHRHVRAAHCDLHLDNVFLLKAQEIRGDLLYRVGGDMYRVPSCPTGHMACVADFGVARRWLAAATPAGRDILNDGYDDYYKDAARKTPATSHDDLRAYDVFRLAESIEYAYDNYLNERQQRAANEIVNLCRDMRAGIVQWSLATIDHRDPYSPVPHVLRRCFGLRWRYRARDDKHDVGSGGGASDAGGAGAFGVASPPLKKLCGASDPVDVDVDRGPAAPLYDERLRPFLAM